MRIRTLLLGSAAALLAVSGARSADAVAAAEPEHAEYVKVCDVYGAGYFYIPGTETCLRIGGYVRYDASFGDARRVLDGAMTHDRLDGDEQQTWAKNARFNLKSWTAQETELGTLKTYTETRFNFGTSGIDAPAINKTVTLNFAWIQLGGLRIGKDETSYDSFIGYAGNVIQDTIIHYGIKDTNLISYYFDVGKGFSGVISLEQGSGADTIDSYVPNVVGGLKYKADWGDLIGVVAYDSNYKEWASKVRLDVKASDALSLFVMGGYGTDDNVADVVSIPSSVYNYKPWYGNWAIWGGGTYTFSKKVAFNAQVSYDEAKDLAVAANIAYTVVPGFVVTAEADYYNNSDVEDSDAVGGIIRFQRNF